MGIGGTLVLALLALMTGCDAGDDSWSSLSCIEQNDLDNCSTIYEYTLPDIYLSRNISLSEYAGKFASQEPGMNATEILNGVKYVRPGGGFEPNFQMFAKLEVNGETETPLYTFLKSQCPLKRGSVRLNENNDIYWNFEKFLIDKSGRPYKRYSSGTIPADITKDIAMLLARHRNQ